MCMQALESLASSGRVRRSVYDLSEAAAAALCEAHPYLSGESGDERRPVLPNLIDATLLVGHQGHALSGHLGVGRPGCMLTSRASPTNGRHALCISEWAGLMTLGGVVNLAPEKVDGTAARAAVAAAVESGVPAVFVEARCAGGEQLALLNASS